MTVILPRLLQEGMAVIPIFEEMQSTGMPVSRSAFMSLQSEMEGVMISLQTQLSALYMDGRPFNPNSPKDVRALMSRRGLTAEKVTATGEDSTAKDSIEHLRYIDEAMALVFDWREAEHIRSAFCVPILDKIADEDEDPSDIQWLRCSIKPTRVHTRRLATSNPNLLAIPARTEVGLKVRNCFIAPEGMVYCAFDLSQIEARVFASFCDDVGLIRLFNSGGDIHTATAAGMWNLPLDQVSKEQRVAAKTINFGSLYGVQGEGLSAQLRKLGIIRTADQCDDYLAAWFDLYPGARDYFNRVEKEIKSTGIVTDESGMSRYLPGVWSNNPHDRAEAVRTAVNHKVQGTSQTMIQRSMIWLKPQIRALQQSGLNIKWCLEVHDELDFVIDEYLWPLLYDLVMEALTKHCGVTLKVPVLAEGKCSRTWGETK